MPAATNRRVLLAFRGNDGRIIEYPEEELRTAAAAGEPLLDDVSKQGLTVAGTRSWLSKQLRPIGKAAPTRRS